MFQCQYYDDQVDSEVYPRCGDTAHRLVIVEDDTEDEYGDPMEYTCVFVCPRHYDRVIDRGERGEYPVVVSFDIASKPWREVWRGSNT